MDITPQVINEVEFHQKMRGYDPDEVDDFLERVATAVTAMQERLREVGERVSQAERRAADSEQRLREAPSGPVSSTIEEETETIRRTLVLAQRTADAAVKEAQEEAQSTVRAAREQADQIYREAQDQAQKVVADAELEARKSAEDTRQRLVAEIIALEEARDSIRADQVILESHVEEHRGRLRGTITELERLLDDPARLRPAPPPPISGATRPAFMDDELGQLPPPPPPELASSQGESSFNDAAPPPPADATDDTATPELDEPAPTEDEPAGAPAGDGVGEPAPEMGGAPASSGLAAATHEEDEAWARFVGDEGPPTGAIRLDDAGDDAYLAELRKAMLDESGPESLFDEGDDQRRSRFGRRR